MRALERTIGAAVVALVLGLAACGDDDGDDVGSGDDEAGVIVTATDFAFSPQDLTVGAGQAITLRNDGEVEHSFTIDDADIDGEADGGEETEIVAPDDPATYDFYCRYHPEQMTGMLTVE